MKMVIQYAMYIILCIIIAVPLGGYISKVMNGEKVFLSRILKPVENRIYKLLKIQEDEMPWKKYFVSVLAFSGVGILVMFLIQMLQGVLPFNPQNIKGTSWDQALNTAISFVTNTNWQAYSGELQLSYLTQALGLTVQNFVSAGVGIAVLYAFIRGLTKVNKNGVGNFWVDLTRSVLYILIPLALIVSVFLVSQGVVQSGKPAETVQLLEPIAVDGDGNVIDHAIIEGDQVIVDGVLVEGATIITEQIVPLGYAASQIAIKQLGTNGGGYYGLNSAHPLENPTWVSNLVQVISILLIPVALCFSFGRDVKDKKQGVVLFVSMTILLVLALGVVAVSEQWGSTVLAENQWVDSSIINQAGGNMEGKEARFGIVASSTWSVFTTAASNGSVNSMLDSYTPLGGMVPMILIELGEVIFGGVGSGLYGMVAFVILAVFIAGLMVGRTPEYLGKKIEPYEMKWAVITCLVTPCAILISTGIAVLIPSITASLNNTGPHGFSEILYAFTSASGNNGSSFAGFIADTVFINLSLGVCMLFARFIPILGILAIAGNMGKKKKIAITQGTLLTSNGLFIFLLIFVVLLVGALTCFPALALGPLAEFFG